MNVYKHMNNIYDINIDLFFWLIGSFIYQSGGYLEKQCLSSWDPFSCKKIKKLRSRLNPRHYYFS